MGNVIRDKDGAVYTAHQLGQFKLLDVQQREGARAEGRGTLDAADVIVLPNGKKMPLGEFLAMTGGSHLLKPPPGMPSYRFDSRKFSLFKSKFIAAYRGRAALIANYLTKGRPESIADAVATRRVLKRPTEKASFIARSVRKVVTFVAYKIHRDDIPAQQFFRAQGFDVVPGSKWFTAFRPSDIRRQMIVADASPSDASSMITRIRGGYRGRAE